MSIEIANESGVEVDTDAILAVARHALDEMGVNPLAELSVHAVPGRAASGGRPGRRR